MKIISVDHLARVEGSGGISATIDGKVVTDVKFSIYEGPRLVERLTIGKTPERFAAFPTNTQPSVPWKMHCP